MCEDGKLRVWWITNVPRGSREYYYVDTLGEAQLVLATLAHHDLHLGEQLVHSNAGGLEVFEDGEWCEWSDPETGDEVNGNQAFCRLRTGRVESAAGCT